MLFAPLFVLNESKNEYLLKNISDIRKKSAKFASKILEGTAKFPLSYCKLQMKSKCGRFLNLSILIRIEYVALKYKYIFTDIL